MVVATATPVFEPKRPPWWRSPSRYSTDLATEFLTGLVDDPSIALLKDEELVEKVERDPVIAKALAVRFHQTAGREVYITARNRPARMLKPYVEELLSYCDNFEEARLLIAKQGVMTGMGWSKMAGEFIHARVGPDLVARRWWVPRFLVHIDKRRLRMEAKIEKATDANGTVQKRLRTHWVLASMVEPGAEYVVDRPEHYVRHHFHNAEATRGYGRGLLESLYFYAKPKTRCFAYLVQGLERFGWPWIHAAMKQANIDAMIGDSFPTSQARTDAVIAALEKMRRSNIIVTGEEDRITPLDLGAAGNSMVLQAIHYFDKAMVELILGSSMPTGGGEQGSFARARVEEETTNTMVEYDRLLLARTLTRDLVSAIVRYNAANFAEIGLATTALPELRIGRELGNDYLLNLKRLEALRAAGLPTRSEDWYSFAGVPMPDSVELPDVVEGLVAVPPMAPSGGAPAEGGEGGETVEGSFGGTLYGEKARAA